MLLGNNLSSFTANELIMDKSTHNIDIKRKVKSSLSDQEHFDIYYYGKATKCLYSNCFIERTFQELCNC